MIESTEAVLVVEDDAALREALIDTLSLAGIETRGAADAASALHALEQGPVALVISDIQMPGIDGYRLLSLIKQRRPDLAVVLMTAYGTVSQAVAAMREGATDYLVKPFAAQALIEMAQRHLRERVAPENLIAVDPESRRLLVLAKRIAETEATVLITGESGTGKEVYARLIHDHSPRADAPYVAINCAAIPENMLEATLFGYEKGAFTGALAAHAGKFEQAQGGSLLLDEISEMSLGLQAKILRVLQEREVERLGSTRTIRLDVRVLATSNRRGSRRAVPRRSLLPAQRHDHAARAAARAPRRHPALGATCAAGLCAQRTPRTRLRRRRGAQAAHLRLAGQCARIDEHRAARGLACAGRPDYGRSTRHRRRLGQCAHGGKRGSRRAADGPRGAPRRGLGSGSQGARAGSDHCDAARDRRQPQACRRALGDQSTHLAAQAAAAQSLGRASAGLARSTIRECVNHEQSPDLASIGRNARAAGARRRRSRRGVYLGRAIVG